MTGKPHTRYGRRVLGVEGPAAEALADALGQLNAMRIASGLSQRELAERIGMTQPTVAQQLGRRWALGGRVLLRSVIRLAAGLGADVLVSFRWKPPMSEGSNDFRCFCGHVIEGAAPEVISGDPTKDLRPDGRWRLWMGQGGPKGAAVGDHIQACAQARVRYVVEIL